MDMDGSKEGRIEIRGGRVAGGWVGGGRGGAVEAEAEAEVAADSLTTTTFFSFFTTCCEVHTCVSSYLHVCMSV